MKNKLIKIIMSMAILSGFIAVDNQVKSIEAAPVTVSTCGTGAQACNFTFGGAALAAGGPRDITLTPNSTWSQSYGSATNPSVTLGWTNASSYTLGKAVWDGLDEATKSLGDVGAALSMTGNTIIPGPSSGLRFTVGTYFGPVSKTVLQARFASTDNWTTVAVREGTLAASTQYTIVGANNLDNAAYQLVFIFSNTDAAARVMLNSLNFLKLNDADIVANNIAADKAQLTTLLSNINGSDNVTAISDLPLLGDNNSVITWTSSDETLVSVDSQTGVVTVNPSVNPLKRSVTLTANLSNTVGASTLTDKVTVTFQVELINSDIRYSVTFAGYDSYNRLDITINDEIDLPTPSAAYGKKFICWKDATGTEYKDTLTVLKDYSLTAVFDNNYVPGVNTMTSIKLGYHVTTGIPVPPQEATLSNSGSARNLTSTGNAALLNLDSSIFTVDTDRGSGTAYLTANADGTITIPSSSISNANGGAISITIANEYKIDSISVNNFVTTNRLLVNDSDYNSFYEQVPAVSGTGIIEINKNNFTIRNVAATSNLPIRFTSLTIIYSLVGGGRAYDITDDAGIRFGAEFTTDAYDNAGVLVIPTHLIRDIYNGSLASFFLAEGANTTTKIANIVANSTVAGNGKLYFAGVITNYPQDKYATELTALCYYVANGQIYFSSEKKISFKAAAQHYLDNPAGLSFDQLAVLRIIASNQD